MFVFWLCLLVKEKSREDQNYGYCASGLELMRVTVDSE